jgi:GNAT superfamily N-acetyltransferase
MAKLKVMAATREQFKDMLELDHSIESNYSFRMVTNVDKTSSTYSFQRVKLPREAHLSYMRDKESLKKSWKDATLVYAGMLDDVLVAYAAIDAKSLPATARVSDLVVMPELRQKGIGRTMLAAVESWAAQNNLDRVLLEIAMRNFPMVEMVKQSGYDLCGFMEQFFPNGDTALFYHKRLA